ncbi:MAG: hypothetical protein RSF34_20815 [Flavobacterium sp.]|uniref:hypothetical protein n=1 Tax=Flavobacteriales TaxID=200644 RepID=UPI002FC703B2
MKKVNALFKMLISYFKKSWGFEDYPLNVWFNPNTEQEDIKYGAGFENWHLFVAHGKNKKEAIENLRLLFEEYKRNNVELPRPGTTVPIKFAQSTQIEKYEEIAVDFFDKIIKMDFYNCFISDYTSLHDFDVDIVDAVKNIKLIYNIVPDEDLVLSEIFKQIEDKRLI